LNVKAFLAGKRGVCPQCGAGLDIPLESQIQKKEKEESEKKPAAKPPGRDKSESVGSEDLMSVPVSSPASVDDVPAAASAGSQLSVPTSSVPKAETTSTSPVASVATVTAPAAPSSGAVPVQPVTPVQPVATPVPAAPVDPIAESPESSWYVRPPSGGQYGPARGEIMRKWITEGRVSSDSLVWREGWDDWLSATDVFPSLGSTSVPPVPAPAPVGFAPASPAPAQSNPSVRPRRRNSSALQITTVVLLGLMAVTLLVTLIVVMNWSS